MAVDVPLRQTAEQAARAFKLAEELRKGFAADRRKRVDDFGRHAATFRELWRLLAETLPELEKPGSPFSPIASISRHLATCLHNVRDKLSGAERSSCGTLPKLPKRPGHEAMPWPTSYTEYGEELSGYAARGAAELRAIEEPRTLAGRAFELADSLGRDFQGDVGNPTQFARCRGPYGELAEILLNLREQIREPRPGFAEFADALSAVGNAVRTVWRVLPESERQALRDSRPCLRDAGSPNERTDHVYAEYGPAISTAAAKGFAAMRTWQAKWQTVDPFESFAEPTERADPPIDEAAFIESLLNGMTARELSPRELALLEALIKRPVSFQQILNEKRSSGGKSPTADRQAKLKSIRNFNRALSQESKTAVNEAEPAEAVDPSRRIPSDFLPNSLGEKLRRKRLAERMFPDGLKIEGAEPDGPHNLELLDCLAWYFGTPHKRAVCNVYFDWSRPAEADLPLIDEEAAGEGLTRQEYLARETLTEIRRFVRANGLPSPTSADSQPGVKVDSGHATGLALETADRETDDSSSRNRKGKPGVKGRGATERKNDAEILRRRKAEPHCDLDALAEQCAQDGLLKVESGQSLNRAIKLAMHRARNDARLARKSGSVHPSRAAGSRTKRRA